MKKDPGATLGIAAAKLVTTVTFTFIISFPAMMLWNECLVPAIPNVLSEVTWTQQFGIMMLINLIVTAKPAIS